MGHHKNIGMDFFPKQNFVGQDVLVYFHFRPERTILGKIVRDDTEKPHVTIIQLDDGRFVLDNECFYEKVNRSDFIKEERYEVREIALEHETKHIVVGSIAARSFLDMDNYPRNVVNEGEVITEGMWRKLVDQGRTVIEIKELVKEASTK